MATPFHPSLYTSCLAYNTYLFSNAFCLLPTPSTTWKPSSSSSSSSSSTTIYSGPPFRGLRLLNTHYSSFQALTAIRIVSNREDFTWIQPSPINIALLPPPAEALPAKALLPPLIGLIPVQTSKEARFKLNQFAAFQGYAITVSYSNT
jgi:hypothetical protein